MKVRIDGAADARAGGKIRREDQLGSEPVRRDAAFRASISWPDLTVNQVSRWFDKRRAMKKIVARIESGEDPDEPLSKRGWKRRKVEKRVRHNERELLEAARAKLRARTSASARRSPLPSASLKNR